MTSLDDQLFLLSALEGDQGVTVFSDGHQSTHVRYGVAMRMLWSLLRLRPAALASPGSRTLAIFQFYDTAQRNLSSLAFGRRSQGEGLVNLILDPYFFETIGYAGLRSAALAGTLPPWRERLDTLFWRGVGSHGHVMANGEEYRELALIPRVRMARLLRDHPAADIGIIDAWHNQPRDQTLAYLNQERILRSAVSMIHHANYRYQIDIDGVANAWGLIERLLCGSCVLKVATPFEMWFYDRLIAWEHYVPVREDLSDLEDRLKWCHDHPGDAHTIANAGQRLALDLTFEAAMEEAACALSRCRLVQVP